MRYKQTPQIKDSGQSIVPALYLESLAYSLILYAEQDKKFKQFLIDSISRYSDTTNLTYLSEESLKKSALLIPKDYKQACKRLYWLKSQDDSYEKRVAIRVLKTSEYEQAVTTRAVLFGLALGVIIGPTLGEPKKKDPMMIIARKDYKQPSQTQFAEIITRLTHEVLKNGIERAGSTKKLEPELGDWFHSHKGLGFYKTNELFIKRIVSDMSLLSVPYAIQCDETGPSILALSPSVNSKYPETRYSLMPFES